uniref:Guanylate cyclase domain-containing protein n=1 Tax=Acrobeloides nanus TaxID=290746 RepID=A0A914D7E5_9BILA
MESTGLSEKIQMSQQACEQLILNYPVFRYTTRGEVEIKGKGKCTTVWLDSKINEQVVDNSNLRKYI